MKVLRVEGIGNVVKKLARTRKNVGYKVESGLTKAGLFLLRESQKIVPVQLGNLQSAGEVRKDGSGLRTRITVGYFGVEYAAYVHEIPSHVWTSKSGKVLSGRTHGREFNIKHAADIAKAKGTWLGTAEGGMFKRKPEEQWKYLEDPIKNNKDEILKIISNEIKKTR